MPQPTVAPRTPPAARPDRRRLLRTWFVVVGLLLGSVLLATSGASAANVPVDQCNGTDNVGGQAVECTVVVENRLDLATGVTSSTVTTTECRGVAGAPPTCTTTPSSSSDLITSVTQCNGSGSGGGGTVTCRVTVVNVVTGVATPQPATVSQCNEAGGGGGTPPTVVCTPLPSQVTGATVDQCNGSGNGGGGTMRVRCTVDADSTRVAALPVTVDQCNGSGNGGGALVTCSASVTTRVVAPEVTPSGSATASASSSSSASASASASATAGPRPGAGGGGVRPTPVPSPTSGGGRVVADAPRPGVPTELPRTGWTARDLAGIAMLLLAAGVLLVSLGGQLLLQGPRRP